MNESPTRRRLSLLGAAWLALVALHVALQALAPRGVFSDPLIPFWARLTLLATEAVATGLVLLPLAGALHLASRGPSWTRSLRWIAVAAPLLLLAASWSSFWLSGQFLDRAGLLFAASNLGDVLGFAGRVHPFLLYGLPVLLLALAVAACELAPRWSAGIGARTGLVAAVVAGLSVLGMTSGEIAHRAATAKVTDPSSGAVYSGDDLYRLRRARNAGPVTHVVSTWFGAKDPFDDGAASPELVRRPIEPAGAYLSSVDRASLRRWNVVVVLIDSLRADQLRATGGTREVMPALEALARESRVFTDCVSAASHTDYSCPAVFSSHYPLRSRDVYRYPEHPSYPRVMIYDVLKALGWRTALHSSQNEHWGQMLNYLQTGNLDDVFHAGMAGPAAELPPDRPRFSGMLDDSATVAHSLEWIARDTGSPFFLYLNLQSSHLPYDVPKDFPRRFATRPRDFEIKIGWFPREKAEVVKDVYADSLAYADAQLDRLLRNLKDRGLWDRTVVVVSGDHGEAFYEHGSAAHANGVHEEVIRVPLVIRAPGLEPGRDARPAHLLDVAPGVFHLLGLPAHPGFQGENPFAASPRADRARYVISDTPWKTQIGVIRSGFKLVRDGDTGGSVLYDLARDPGETADASGAHPEIARDLKARLSGWRRAQLEYYDNPVRQSREYPPVFRD